MVKSSTAANVIDLEAFRQRKLREERGSEEVTMTQAPAAALMVPVWICWVPMWTPIVG